MSFTAGSSDRPFQILKSEQRNCNDERDTGDDGPKKSVNFDCTTESLRDWKVRVSFISLNHGETKFFFFGGFLGAKCIAVQYTLFFPAWLIFWGRHFEFYTLIVLWNFLSRMVPLAPGGGEVDLPVGGNDSQEEFGSDAGSHQGGLESWRDMTYKTQKYPEMQRL